MAAHAAAARSLLGSGLLLAAVEGAWLAHRKVHAASPRLLAQARHQMEPQTLIGNPPFVSGLPSRLRLRLSLRLKLSLSRGTRATKSLNSQALLCDTSPSVLGSYVWEPQAAELCGK